MQSSFVFLQYVVCMIIVLRLMTKMKIDNNRDFERGQHALRTRLDHLENSQSAGEKPVYQER